MFLQNILHDDATLKHCDDVAAVSDLDCTAYMDNRAVDLLLNRYVSAVFLDLTKKCLQFSHQFINLF